MSYKQTKFTKLLKVSPDFRGWLEKIQFLKFSLKQQQQQSLVRKLSQEVEHSKVAVFSNRSLKMKFEEAQKVTRQCFEGKMIFFGGMPALYSGCCNTARFQCARVPVACRHFYWKPCLATTFSMFESSSVSFPSRTSP